MSFEADPYRTLGLTRGASLEEVKRAYRRLAKVNHPDAAGPAALPRFLAIQAAYERIAGPSTTRARGGKPPASTRRSPSAADADRADATRRAYGGRSRPAGTGSPPAGGARSTSQGRAGRSTAGGRTNAPPPGASGSGTGTGGASTDGAAPGGTDHAPGATDRAPGGTRTGRTRGKATLGSTSYDDADTGPFEPDWGGASWYGTTSGTYWTINPREYADPRKHGPEYQARARRTAQSAADQGDATPGGRRRPDQPEPGARPAPTHTTASWWDSTAGPSEGAAGTDPEAPRTAAADRPTVEEPAPDPARAAIDLARSLTDPRSGGWRGRVVRAVLGGLPIALGLGWLVGELTGCGRFAATCDPSVAPLTFAGQAIVLAGLLLLNEIAALAAGAALVLLAAATAASLILSATGAAADEGSRRTALAVLLVLAWLGGFAVAALRRVRAGRRPARPVS